MKPTAARDSEGGLCVHGYGTIGHRCGRSNRSSRSERRLVADTPEVAGDTPRVATDLGARRRTSRDGANPREGLGGNPSNVGIATWLLCKKLEKSSRSAAVLSFSV